MLLLFLILLLILVRVLLFVFLLFLILFLLIFLLLILILLRLLFLLFFQFLELAFHQFLVEFRVRIGFIECQRILIRFHSFLPLFDRFLGILFPGCLTAAIQSVAQIVIGTLLE